MTTAGDVEGTLAVPPFFSPFGEDWIDSASIVGGKTSSSYPPSTSSNSGRSNADLPSIEEMGGGGDESEGELSADGDGDDEEDDILEVKI